jgi:cytochrome c5
MNHNHASRINFYAFFQQCIFLLAAAPLMVAVILPASSAEVVTSQERDATSDIWQGIFTNQQADRGKAVFQDHCATCHDANGLGEAPALVAESFLRNWEGRTVGRLYTKILEMMPPNDVQSVSGMQKLDVLAFILRENGFPVGGTELTGDVEALSRIQLLPQGGAAPLRTGAMVQVMGCLAEGPANGWLLTRSTEPVATTLDPPAVGHTDTSQSRPLGTGTIRLLAVFPSPQALTGHRVEAKGLLVKTGADLSVNVVSIRSVSPTCQ